MLTVNNVISALNRHGKVEQLKPGEWCATCPAHHDRTPSLSVKDAGDKALFHCHAGCSQDEVTEALKRLMPEFSVNSRPKPKRVAEETEERQLSSNESVAQKGNDLKEFSFPGGKLLEYEQALQESAMNPDSLVAVFLRDRGISLATAKELRYGLRTGNCQALVLPRFWNGELAGVKYRSLDGLGQKWRQEPGSRADFIYCLDQLPVNWFSDVVGVFEGELDTALAHALGFNAVGIFGTSGVPPNPSQRFLESIEQLKQNCNHVVLIGDADEVGENAMHKLHDYIGRGCLFAQVPRPHKDITELYQAEGEARLRKWLGLVYTVAAGCTPLSPSTPAERLKDSLTRALIQVDDGVEPRALISMLRSEFQTFEDSRGFPDSLGEAAFQGIFGEIVREGLPHTEADESCLLYQSLTTLGNLLGRKQCIKFGTDRHYPNLFTLIIGKTNAGKGQGLSQVRHLISQIDEDWADHGCKFSAASGEALVRLVSEREQASDGRLCLIMPEMSVLLNSMNRDGSNTSGYLRVAYDGLPLENQRSQQSHCAKNYLLSVLGHITPEELSDTMQSVDWANGIANRFLWAAVRPSKTLARHTAAPSFSHVQETVSKILSLPDAVSIDFSQAGGECWDEWVRALPELEGKLALSQARIRPNALRVAEIYAVFDERRLEGISFVVDKGGKPEPHFLGDSTPKIQIEPEHIKAAIEVVTRSRQTVEWYLQTTADGMGTSHVDVIKARIEANRNGGRLSGTELYRLFSHRTSDQRIEIASRAGLKLRKQPVGEKGGKPPEIWTF
jgi:hypothetical protein